MNKNTILAYGCFFAILVGIILIGLAFYFRNLESIALGIIGLGFFAIAWVFSSLKGRI